MVIIINGLHFQNAERKPSMLIKFVFIQMHNELRILLRNMDTKSNRQLHGNTVLMRSDRAYGLLELSCYGTFIAFQIRILPLI